MNIPNISGIRILNKEEMAEKRQEPVEEVMRKINRGIPTVPMKINTTSSFGEEVDMLMNSYNDKAFIYNSGKVDIVKKGNIRTIKFKSKKMASLYLMKVGWKYV